jgi:hypothetical protein
LSLQNVEKSPRFSSKFDLTPVTTASDHFHIHQQLRIVFSFLHFHYKTTCSRCDLNPLSSAFGTGMVFAEQAQASVQVRATLQSEDSGSVHSSSILTTATKACTTSQVENGSTANMMWSCASTYSTHLSSSGYTIYYHDGTNSYSWAATNVTPPNDRYKYHLVG